MAETEITKVQQLIPTILELSSDTKVLKCLEQFDQKYIAKRKLQLIQKIPNQLRPNQPPKIPQTSLKFTEIVKTVHENIYQYVKQDIMTIIQAAKQWEERQLQEQAHLPSQKSKSQIHMERLQNQIAEKQVFEKISQVEISEKKEERNNEKIMAQPIGQQLKKQQINQILSNSRAKSSQKKIQPKIKKYPPFIPNKFNFLDCNANSKHLNDYASNVSLTEYAQNIVSMTQKSKAQAFTTKGFPGSVIGGNIQHPRQTIFAPQSKLDVQDIMRYTLGVNASTSSKVREQMQNPFSRIRRRKQEE